MSRGTAVAAVPLLIALWTMTACGDAAAVRPAGPPASEHFAAAQRHLAAYASSSAQDGRETLAQDNVAAAEALAALAPSLRDADRRALAARLRDVLEAMARRDRDVLPTAVLEAGFRALGRLGGRETVAWLFEHHVHARSSHVRWIRAALRALPEIETVSGPRRREAVSTLIEVYAGVEASSRAVGSDPRSARDVGARRVWTAVGTDVIAALRHFAGPTAVRADGSAFEHVRAFQHWVRDNRDPYAVPWRDD